MTQDRRTEKVESKVGKEKKKDEKSSVREKKERDGPPTKIIIRRLPPTLTKEQFVEQIAPMPEHDYFHFYKADYSLGVHAMSRAYINFLNPDDIWLFKEKFDRYVFLDSKGNEYPAIVEIAPFQKIPKKKPKKLDVKKGTIEHDGDYLKFLGNLKEPNVEPIPAPEKFLEEIEAREKELKGSGSNKTTTPLLDYISRKKEEKRQALQRARDEKKRREIERRKQREDERRRRKEREKEMMLSKDREREKENEWKEEVQFKLLKKPSREKEEEQQRHERDEESDEWDHRRPSSSGRDSSRDKYRSDRDSGPPSQMRPVPRFPRDDVKKSYAKDRPKNARERERERERERQKEREKERSDKYDRDHDRKKKKVPTATLR